MEKLLLIDGNSIMNRAFYALPTLTDSKGRYTNAILGFLNTILKTIETENPTHMIVTFDRKAKTFRHKLYSEYKGNRKGMPDELREQMPMIKEVLDIMNVSMYEQDGIEADDILGTLSLEFEDVGDVTILSGDRDILQLASKKTKVSIPTTKAKKTTIKHYYWDDFVEEYGYTPIQFIDAKGLMGDSSDNIPGVAGVGPKTVLKLLQKYKNIEGVYEHIDELKGKQKEKIETSRDIAFLSRELATIKRDCNIKIDYKECKLENYLNAQAYELFKELELNSLLYRFKRSDMPIESNKTIEYKMIENIKELFSAFKDSKKEVAVFYTFEETKGKPKEGNISLFDEVPKDNGIITLGLSDGKTTYIYEETDFNKKRVELIGFLQGLPKAIHFDYKKLLHILNVEQNIKSNYEDVMIMYYLLKPNKSNYDISELGLVYTDVSVETEEELLGKGKKRVTFSTIEEKKRYDYIAKSAYILYESFLKLTEELAKDEMLGLYNTLEKPLVEVLYSMERKGILVDKEVLTSISENLESRIAKLVEGIYDIAGEEFNINSPKQLGHVLFDNMKLRVIKKTKTGYSTSAEVLEQLKSDSPIIKMILDYRTLSKLKSTYADGLFPCVKDDNRIHTTFNQTIASTGRLSSTEPNLQNIPIRLEEGRLIRKAFVAGEDTVFIDADYSQIELRVLAHLSEDPAFLQAYKENLDIHTMTASNVFHVPFDEVNSTMRRNAKAVNFGIVYGISDYGLSKDLDISVKEAREYINNYFEKYPGIKGFLDMTVAMAKADGYVTTMYNRKRNITELSSSNYMTRQAGERVAMNTPIQGSAADIIKIAMIKVYKRLLKEGLKSKLILQVHDELIIETPISEKEKVFKLLKEEMETAVKLDIPLTVDIKEAKDWYEAK